jgi:hypothetical protein
VFHDRPDNSTHHLEHEVRGVPAVTVTLDVRGRPTIEPLAPSLSDLDGVFEVTTTDLAQPSDQGLAPSFATLQREHRYLILMLAGRANACDWVDEFPSLSSWHPGGRGRVGRECRTAGLAVIPAVRHWVAITSLPVGASTVLSHQPPRHLESRDEQRHHDRPPRP